LIERDAQTDWLIIFFRFSSFGQVDPPLAAGRALLSFVPVAAAVDQPSKPVQGRRENEHA
jgi:hypothetical protein